jgi:hypothetical protein
MQFYFLNFLLSQKNNCKSVEQAVLGVADSKALHWLNAVGIIDSDNRAISDLVSLKSKGVFSIPFYSIESIYYHPKVQRLLAVRQKNILGGDVDQYISNSNQKILECIENGKDHLARKIVEKRIREEIISQLPIAADLKKLPEFKIIVGIEKKIADETNRISSLIAAKDCAALIARYPVRKTQTLDQIAKALGFQGRSQYESAVRNLLNDDAEAVQAVKELFSETAMEIETFKYSPTTGV